MVQTAQIQDSDKHYWHRYTETYEHAFNDLAPVTNILEFGVLHGASTRWLYQRFPEASIIGVDILPVQNEWPQDARISYFQLDQGNQKNVATLFKRQAKRFDLVIEDGSHIPQHQAICLVEGLSHVRSGGLYILEDIHTSHPEHAYLTGQQGLGPHTPTALSVLLAIQHLKEIQKPLDAQLARELSAPDFFSPEQVIELSENIANLSLYRRTSFPLRCYNCGSSDFDYARYRCKCGIHLYEVADSMSFLIWRK